MTLLSSLRSPATLLISCLATVAAIGCTTGADPIEDGGAEMDAPLIVGFDGGGGIDAGARCMVGTVDCAGSCTRLAWDEDHCGSCGNACPEGITCAAGECNCAAPMLSCRGICRDPMTDIMNCGTCGNVCGGLEMCTGGECIVHCDAPGEICYNPVAGGVADGSVGDLDAATGEDAGVTGGDAGEARVAVCADLMTDPNNCGHCNSRCVRGSTCIAGACACPPGQQICGGSCVDALTDPLNCGSCGTTCGTGGSCAGGMCTCGSDRTNCSGRCVDTITDRNNCGVCARRCATGEACEASVCACVAPRRVCSGLCSDGMTDPLNCGTCGTNCGPSGVCTAGICGCAAGLDICSGSCRNLSNDLANCGTCGMVCPPLTGGVCAAGTCGCPAGQMDCSGTCRTTMTDRNNCGVCGMVCGAGMACQAGTCVLADSFRMRSFDTTNCRTVQHDPPSSDDRGGIAVSSSHVFITGDGATVRLSAADLSGLSAVTPSVVHDGMIGDLETEQVYVLLTAAGTEVTGAATITQLGLLDGATGMLTATRVPLSMPITTVYGSGVFSGYGEALIGVATGGLQWWRIELPSGVVTRLGNTQSPTHRTCENWAWWGIAELFGDVHYAAYVESSTRISRLAIPATGTTANPPVMISAFSNLGDMCSITFSPSRNRWYFHHEYDSQFSATPSGEIGGSCDGAFDRP